MHSRREVLAAVSLAALPLAGCSATKGSYSFAADRASVPASTLAETQWSKANENSPTFNESVSVGGQDVEVTMNSHVITYQADYEGAPLAFASLLSTPQASVAGQSINPAGHLGNQRLIEMALRQIGSVQEASKQKETEIQMLGKTATVTYYRGTTEQRSSKVRILLTKVAHDEDYVIASATFPTELSGAESDTLDLFRSVEH